MTTLSRDRFDGARVWQTLTPEAQAAIGATALEFGVAMALLCLSRDTVLARAAVEAMRVAEIRLGDEVCAETAELLATDDGRYHLPSILGPVCERCGCSQHDPCGAGCGWRDFFTCTACA